MDFTDKLKGLRARLDKFPALQNAEDKTNIPKEYIGLGGGVFALLVLVFGVGIASLCRLIGFAYPAFKSFQAIETKIKGDIVQWQVYWIIFSMFQLIEVFQDILVYWIPFYFAFKLAFLLWLMLPQTKGATFMYDAFLKDFLKKQSKIDAALSEAKKQGNAIASDFNTYSTNDSPKNK